MPRPLPPRTRSKAPASRLSQQLDVSTYLAMFHNQAPCRYTHAYNLHFIRGLRGNSASLATIPSILSENHQEQIVLDLHQGHYFDCILMIWSTLCDAQDDENKLQILSQWLAKHANNHPPLYFELTYCRLAHFLAVLSKNLDPHHGISPTQYNLVVSQFHTCLMHLQHASFLTQLSGKRTQSLSLHCMPNTLSSLYERYLRELLDRSDLLSCSEESFPVYSRMLVIKQILSSLDDLANLPTQYPRSIWLESTASHLLSSPLAFTRSATHPSRDTPILPYTMDKLRCIVLAKRDHLERLLMHFMYSNYDDESSYEDGDDDALLHSQPSLQPS